MRACEGPYTIFSEHYQSVFFYFIRRGFSRDQSQDLTQETFLEVLRTRGRYRGEASAGSWVFGIARNVYRGALRYHSRQKRSADVVPLESWLEHESITESEPRAGAAQPLDLSMAMERAKLFRQAIKALSPSQRDCLLLRIDQELAYREIADLLGISVEAVKARLFQAKKSLRLALCAEP